MKKKKKKSKKSMGYQRERGNVNGYGRELKGLEPNEK
jgi:hypothetical protein